MRKTKIVCTIGPASEHPDMLCALMDAGMNVARLNMSHGSHEEHGRRIQNIKRLRARRGVPLPIMLDTQGPEVRIGSFRDERVQLRPDDHFTLTSRAVEGSREIVSITYPGLCARVRPGARILIDDGLIALDVLRVEQGTDVVCRVADGGTLGSRKGVSVPGVDLEIPSIGRKDYEDILFGVRMGVDLIAASFVCRASDVLSIRRILAENGADDIQIIAKIENRMGVDHFDEILKAADGVMVARGDLGVEVDMEEVPVLQKMIIRKCNIAGKPVITATQMLDSMIRNPRPTRAEANDVANSILDGTDALMLSGETANGRYPPEAVRAMARIANYVESQPNVPTMAALHSDAAQRITLTNAVSHACYTLSRDLNARAIITPTHAGVTPRLVAKYRPACALIAATENERAYHQLGLVWGVCPLRMERTASTDDLIRASVRAACDAGYLSKGDIVILTAGVPTGVSGTTNLIKVHIAGGAPL